MNSNLPQLRKKALTLPQLPGVYLMKDSQGGVLYVGKARSLRGRVSQYFGADGSHGHAAIAYGLDHVADFDYIVVSSEHEALVLENSLIKQHAPKYNILLKDGKGHRYVRVTREEYPRLSYALQKRDDGALYLGPYTSAYAVKLAVEEVQQIFRLPTCSRQFPRDIGRGRPCLQFFIERCSGVCAKKISKESYAQSVAEAVDFLRHGSAQSEKKLRREMEEASEQLQFERAARCRDLLRAMEQIKARQSVVSVAVEEQDVFALAAEQTQACWMVLRFAGGKLYDSEHFFLEAIDRKQGTEIAASPEAALRQELLERYYTMRGDNLPKRVLLDAEVADQQLLEEWLSGKAGHKVSILVGQKGEPARLLALCRQNALEQLAHRTGRQSKSIAALEELAKLLDLPAPPAYIEAYDISHTAGADNVAGMVVFQNGAPLKSAYKRFAVKGFSGQDDYASMAEVLSRRLRRYTEQKESGEGFGRLPDLILLDGGLGQVHAVEPVLQQFGLDIPLFGMVKDSKHRTRAIQAGSKEIAFGQTSRAFSLVTQIQDEVHRFAIAYHHQKHGARALDSELTQIPGIGPARAKALLSGLKTMKAIRAAAQEELAALPGMNAAAAKAVWNTYHTGGRDQEAGSRNRGR
ncbi:MAG: excinuclease ABC subunit UvrC [Oscillospiraceae bacterium]|jgi:excinuclease ABC subunit C|nr:excinuclease ABC subunit UvrC [Oscillospiraceae bacterium]